MPKGTCFKKFETVSTRFPKDSKRNSPNYKNVIDTKIRHDIKLCIIWIQGNRAETLCDDVLD